MIAAEILAEIHSRGGTVYRRGDLLRIEPRSALTLELFDRVRAQKAELLSIVPLFDWRNDLATWPPAKHARWSANAACLEVLDGLSREEANTCAYEVLAAEKSPSSIEELFRGRAFVLLGEDLPADLGPDLARVLGVVEWLDRAYATGADAVAQRAAERLQALIDDLGARGAVVYLASVS